MADASIVLKLLDKLSPGLSAVRRATEQTERSFEELSGKVSALKERNKDLNETYTKLQTKIVDAKKAVQDATKAYKENADEANRTRLDKAELYYKRLTDSMQRYKSMSADTRKEIQEMEREMRKLEDASAGGFFSTGDGSLTAYGMAASGLVKQLGSSVTGMSSMLLNSALGATEAGIVNSVLSGAASGAAIGSLVPGGTISGAVAGGVSGLIEGLTAQWQREDDAFRDYRDELLTAAVETQSAALSSGIATAAQRQQDSIAFRYLLGDGAESTVLLNSLKELANVTPYVYDDLTGISRQLAIFDSTSGDLYSNLVRIGNAGSALGKSASEMQGLAQVLGKIGDSEKYEATYTRSLRNYGINPAGVIQRVFGVDAAEAGAMLSDMSGAEVLSAIWRDFDTQYGGSMEAMAETYGGALSTREGLTSELENFMGEGYTGSRALKEHNDWLNQFVQGEAYSIIGRANAQKENIQDALYRDVFGGVFNGDEATVADEGVRKEIAGLRDRYLSALAEYETADEQRQMEIGVDVSSILTATETLYRQATDTEDILTAWRKSEISTLEEIGAQVANIKGHRPGLLESRAAEKGLTAAALSDMEFRTPSFEDDSGLFPDMPQAAYNGLFDVDPSAFSSAVGKHVIPHNDFPILAHEGEMLLTASEARAYQEGGGTGGITIRIDEMNVRQESDIDAIAEALAQKILQAKMILA